MSDLIERDKVMNILEDMDVGIIPYAHARKYAQITIDHIRKQIENIPSARPKEGKWIEVTNGRGGHECSECHDYAPSFQSGAEHLSHFCPNCGADMREDEPQTECDNDCPYRVDRLGCMRLGSCYKESE